MDFDIDATKELKSAIDKFIAVSELGITTDWVLVLGTLRINFGEEERIIYQCSGSHQASYTSLGLLYKGIELI